MKFRHYLITRFNLGYERRVASDFIDWHKKRLWLFETFCLKSATRHNNKAFGIWFFILEQEGI